jgi:hypothetical protein
MKRRWRVWEEGKYKYLSVVGLPIVVWDRETNMLTFFKDAELAVFNGIALAHGLLSLCANQTSEGERQTKKSQEAKAKRQLLGE